MHLTADDCEQYFSLSIILQYSSIACMTAGYKWSTQCRISSRCWPYQLVSCEWTDF